MKHIDKEILAKITSLFEDKNKRIIIVTHMNPDGDALGSAIGLANILNSAGCNINIIIPNSYPAFYEWMNCQVDIFNFEKEKEKVIQLFNDCNILICIDFNEPDRAGNLKRLIKSFSGDKILIDHHPDPEVFCNLVISDTTYSSTAELIYDFIIGMGLKDNLDKTSSEALFAGIMTDTGSFSHNISHPNTFKVVSELIQFGINADRIHSSVYHNYSVDRMKFLGHCLKNRMEIFPEYRTAIIFINKNDLKEYNFVPGDTEGFVNYPLSIKGIIFSALFIEKEGYVKISFRSKGSFSVNEFSSRHFHGGGHLNAAGGESFKPMEKTLEKFRQLLKNYEHLLLNA